MVQRRIVLVGAGFAGLAAARALDARIARGLSGQTHATLVAAGPVAHLSPLVPALVSGWVEPWQVLVPLQSCLRHVRWVPARAVSIDVTSKTLALDGAGVRSGSDPATLPYDDLVLAVGGQPARDHVEGASDRALVLRTADDALRIRNRLSQALEMASGERSARRRRALLTVVVAGSGSLACTIALECAAYLRNSYRQHPRIHPEDLRVIMSVEGDRPCSDLADRDAALVARLLDDVGIEVLSGSVIAAVQDRHVIARSAGGDMRRLDAACVVWASNDSPATVVAGVPGLALSKGRVSVDDMLRANGVADLFALGSCASMTTGGMPQCDTPARMVGQGRLTAFNLDAKARGVALIADRGAPPVDALSLDRDWGLAAFGSRRLTGLAAACLARAITLSITPGWARRQTIRGSWMLRRLTSIDS